MPIEIYEQQKQTELCLSFFVFPYLHRETERVFEGKKVQATSWFRWKSLVAVMQALTKCDHIENLLVTGESISPVGIQDHDYPNLWRKQKKDRSSQKRRM